MIGVIDLSRTRSLPADLARAGLDEVEVFGAESPVEGMIRARGAGYDPVVLLPRGGSADSVAALVRALQRGLADAAALTPTRPGLRAALGGALLRKLSGLELRRLPSGPIAVTAEALKQVTVEAFEDGPGYGLALLLALHERGRRVIDLPAGDRARGLTAGLRLGARAWLARRRGVLGFEGPATLPASGVPSVMQGTPPPKPEGDDSRAPRPLPLVSDTERKEREEREAS